MKGAKGWKETGTVRERERRKRREREERSLRREREREIDGRARKRERTTALKNTWFSSGLGLSDEPAAQ